LRERPVRANAEPLNTLWGAVIPPREAACRPSLVCTLLTVLLLLASPIVRGDAATDAKVMRAVRGGDIQGLESLIDQGVDVRSPSLLKFAVDSEQTGVVQLLLRHGSDPNGWITDRYTMNPTDSPIYIAAKRGNRDILEQLKEHGVKVDAERPTDSTLISTPLLCAVYYGDLDTAQRLIDFGADVNHPNQRGNTALLQAVLVPSDRQIKFVAHGANPDVANDQSNTARAYARSSSEVSALIDAAKPPTTAQRLPPGGAEELLNIQMVLTTKRLCDAHIVGFQQETAAAYRRWREPRAVWVDAIERSPQFQAMLEQIKSQEPSAAAAVPAQQQRHGELESTCRGELVDEYEKVPGAAPDLGLATPEKTWKRYLEALRTRDRRSAIGCLTSTARDKFRPILEQSTPQQLRALADAVRSFALTGAKFGNIAEAAVSMNSGFGGIVYFENVNGEWRISEM